MMRLGGMKTYVALLRAVNVGGTGKLPMADLKRICIECGFANVETYIASGNVVLDSGKTERQVKSALEAALSIYAGKPAGVMVRTTAEMEEVLTGNPFPETAPNRTVAAFLEGPPDARTMQSVSGLTDERIALGRREIYIAYGAGMGQSKLKLPAAAAGTARNMNTVAKLAMMAKRHDR